MASYTIQEDAPWMSNERHSVYSDDTPDSAVHVDKTTPQSLEPPSFHAHPRQEITDSGPNNRNSRLPIFKQVRSMLSKPGGQAKWDELSGEPSETGRPSQNVRPSAYVSPWQGAFQARRHSPDRKTNKTKKNPSPISVLRDSEDHGHITPPADRDSLRPISPVSPVSTVHSIAPSQVSVNAVSKLPPGVNVKSQVKRKAVKAPTSPTASENIPPQDWHRTSDEHAADAQQQASHFSWSTVAPSLAPHLSKNFSTSNRGSAETTLAPGEASNSRFSWSTIATNTTYAPPMDSSHTASPVPPIPSHYLEPTTSQYSNLPTQSILSRKRPVQRFEKDDWTPSAQSTTTATSRATSSPAPKVVTPTTPARPPAYLTPAKIITTPDPTSGAKALPLPPFMTDKQATHLEYLLTQEKNLLMQRRNIEKAIADLEGVEKASPLEVSFATVRDARRRLEGRREVLREVRREEMELGIKIARARRKEDFGEGEGTLWVRRVTG
nr:hypothetical protein B0A51_17636 [Rachicladosporium sp. CCFEE 5018]